MLLRDYQFTTSGNGPAPLELALGVTLHLSDTLDRHAEGLAHLANAFASSELGQSAGVLRDWSEPTWEAVAPIQWPAILASMIDRIRNRPFARFELANRPWPGDVVFGFQNVPSTPEAPRASSVYLRLPSAATGQQLLRWAREAADSLPFSSATAGYVFLIDERDRDLALETLWTCARRLWGVEVCLPEVGSWDAPRGLLGVNWLTMLGHSLIEARLPDLLQPSSARGSLTLTHARNGIMIQAGPDPTPGDINVGAFPNPYADAAQLVERALVPDPGEFPLVFAKLKSSGAWQRRFLDPEGWLEAGRD